MLKRGRQNRKYVYEDTVCLTVIVYTLFNLIIINKDKLKKKKKCECRYTRKDYLFLFRNIKGGNDLMNLQSDYIGYFKMRKYYKCMYIEFVFYEIKKCSHFI